MVRCRFLSGCNTVLIAGSNDPVATLKPSSQTLRNRLNDLDIWPHNHVESPHLVALLNLDKIALPSGFTIKMHQGMAPEAKEPTKTKVWSPVSGFGLPWDDIWICDMWDFGYAHTNSELSLFFLGFKKGRFIRIGTRVSVMFYKSVWIDWASRLPYQRDSRCWPGKRQKGKESER